MGANVTEKRYKGHDRCCNIDWLEVFCLEPVDLYPLDADYFFRCGIATQRREYGTRIYNQMFTILDSDGEPCIEIRRDPKSSSDFAGIMSPYSCHIRLVNRYCYFDNAVDILRQFLARHRYTFCRIFRIDICLDFERFDLGDDPQKFIVRYLRHKFAKINQANRTTRGEDRWDGCADNYVSWGQPKSMVSTKLYNKSKELAEAKSKPYIIQAWQEAHIIDDPVNLTKVNSHGQRYKPVVWRVEFSVKSGAAGWAIIEDCTGHKTKQKPIANTLDCYDSREKILMMFASLAHHYFHFKYYEPNKRKDRCRDKALFCFDFTNDRVYHLERVSSATPPPTDEERLRRALERYAEKHYDPKVKQACAVLLTELTKNVTRSLLSPNYTANEFQVLQAILSRHIKFPDEPIEVTTKKIRDLFAGIGETF